MAPSDPALPPSVVVTDLDPRDLVPGGSIAQIPHVLGMRSWRPPDMRRYDTDRLPWGHALPSPVRRGIYVGPGAPPRQRRRGSTAGARTSGPTEAGDASIGALGGGPRPGLDGLAGILRGPVSPVQERPLGLSSAEPTTTHSNSDTGTDSGGHTSTPADQAEADAHTGFVQGLGGAVALGNDAAWAYATGYLGEGWLTEAPNPEPCTQPAPLPSTWGHCTPRADQATLYAFAGEPPCGWCPDLSDAAVANAAASLRLRVLPDITPQWWWAFEPVGALAVTTMSVSDSGWWLGPAFTRGSEEAELIAKAWAVLVQSKDAILWAANYVEGLPLYLDLLYELIEPPGYVDIVLTTSAHLCTLGGAVACTYVDPSQPMDLGAAALDIVFPGPVGDVVGTLLGQPTALLPPQRATIHVIRGPNWDRFLNAFRENELCGAISLAGTILHEMWHVVRDWQWADSLGTGQCYPPYHLESLFLLALYGACTEAAEAPCCSAQAVATHIPFQTVWRTVPC